MKEKIIFKNLSGSYLYGTNGDNSDKDYKGVFLPDLNDLILGKAPKHYTFSTGSLVDKNTADDVDETYYSLQYFLDLAAKGDTNAIDILFAYTNEDAVIYKSDIWNEIIQNIDKILTKNVKAYLSYCKSQCIKYSIKGDKLNNFKKFLNFCEMHQYDVDKNGAKITVKQALNNILGDFKKYIPEPNSERIKFDRYDFGDHCYILTSLNKESYISISDVKICLKDKIIDAKHKIERTIESYGKRAEQASNKNGVDWKAISHCVRVLLQVEELLTTNKITFPLINANFVKAIKYNTIDMTYEEIMKWIENHIMHIDDILLPKSTLREKADYKWIEEFILKQYNKSYIKSHECK